MRRRAFLAAAVAIATAGCTSGSDETNSDDSSGESWTSSTQTLSPGDRTEFDHFAVTVESVDVLDSLTLSTLGIEKNHEFGPERLAVSMYELEAITPDVSDPVIPSTLEPAAVIDGTKHELDVGDEFDDVEICAESKHVDYTECRDVNHRDSDLADGRFDNHYWAFEAGQSRDYWTAGLVPGDTDVADIRIDVDGVQWSGF